METLTTEKYKKSEKKQTLHRTFNTLLSICVLLFCLTSIKQELTPIYEEVTGIKEARSLQEDMFSEILQIGKDEGYRRCVYKDTRGIDTVGWGHKMLSEDKFRCIDPHYAVKLLRKDYERAKDSVERLYPWAEGEVKLVLINMTFNMGATGLSKFENMLAYLQAEEYDKAAGEVLDSLYGRQVPNRASLMAVRLMRLQR